MDVAQYAACDGTELRRLIDAGEVSALQVREAALRAVEAVEPRLNAVVSGPYEDAEGAADGPLAGVPFAVKDTLPEAGRPYGFGTRMLDGYVAPRDGTLAERFRAAGLVSLVRSATPEFAFNVDTAPVVHGPTRNPWDPDRSPGGSSGGSAALVAARALPMGHANDGGGSIRIPAAWCGLVGLKPSRGRVPLGPAVGEAVGGFAHEFAVTRTVRDAALLLDAVNGPSPGDRYYVARPDRPYASSLGDDAGPLRVAVHTTSFFGVETEPEATAAVRATARALEEMGHEVEEACPRIDLDAVLRAVAAVWNADLAGLALAFARMNGREAGPDTVETASLACIRRGRELTALDLAAAAAVVNSTSRRWGRFLEQYDLFLCPTTPTAAPPSGTPDQNDPAHQSDGDWIDAVFPLIPYTPIANLTGQPALSLPLGEASDGMPLGVMLTAQTLREDLLLAVAARLEEAMPWADRTPAIHAGRSSAAMPRG
ncbi:MAG TPA: amidase [Solirubrobacteraceae bacterium]|nr:amidase [Solirubrobacteraceae bacterium]